MERDLFTPIKSFFEEQGYVCDGEVNDIDIFMQKEDALLVLNALFVLGGEASPKEVKKLSFVDKTANILRDNHYGLFSHVRAGLYSITDSGYQAIDEYQDTINLLKATPRD